MNSYTGTRDAADQHSTMLFAAFPAEIIAFLNDFQDAGDFWLVGGCVRDAMLGKTPKDFDFVTTTPQVLDGRYPQIGKAFPVYQTKVGEHTVEIAAARTEKKTGVGHNGFAVELTRSLADDLQRRDLTVNAMAWRPSTGLTTVDGALADIEKHRLRHVSEAFQDDPLRVQRAARFSAQLGWSVASETLALMRTLVPELPSLSKDRVREELAKALVAKHPDAFFNTLRAAGCLDFWFPEVASLVGKPHTPKHHPEGDAFDHTMMVLRKARDLGVSSLPMMLACLGHDFGKALTDPSQWPKHTGHEEFGLVPVKQFCSRLGFGHQVLAAMQLVTRNHMRAHKAFELRASTIRTMLKSASRTIIGVDGFTVCCQADACGRGEHWNDEYPQMAFFNAAYAALKDVQVVPGWTIGKIDNVQIAALAEFKKAWVTGT